MYLTFFSLSTKKIRNKPSKGKKKKKKTKNGCRLHPLRLLKQKVADAGDECKLHPLKESKPPSDESLVGARWWLLIRIWYVDWIWMSVNHKLHAVSSKSSTLRLFHMNQQVHAKRTPWCCWSWVLYQVPPSIEKKRDVLPKPIDVQICFARKQSRSIWVSW